MTLTLNQWLVLAACAASVGGASLLFGLVTIGLANYKEDPVRNRLLSLKGQDYDQGANDPFVERLQAIKWILLGYVERMSRGLYGKNKSYQEVIRKRLTEAGMPETDLAVWQFMTKRLLYSFIAGLALLFITLILGMSFTFVLGGLITGLLAGGIGAEFMLSMKARKRRDEIRYTLSDTLDLMVVCMEAGLGLDATIQKVSDETAKMAPDLSYEFRRLTKELSVGVTRVEAFHNMAGRVGVDEVKSLSALIIQSDKLGTSIADTLRVYAEDVRTKRRQRAEELAAKASIKMTFPLVLFIFPPMFIVLMGPTVINALKLFAHK
jgi:tight adherence protein C